MSLHHMYRTVPFLGEELKDQKDATSFAPRCNKDFIEEMIFFEHRDMFTHLDLVFFDTTSIYFEGHGGNTLGERGFNRPDLNQMIVGAVIDDNGKPLCCEMWPGNTADVTTLIPVVDKVRNRFGIGRFCIVTVRETIIASLTEQIKMGPKSLVGNKGYRKYVKIDKGSVSIDKDKVSYESRFDGKWVLQTNSDLTAEQAALKYKELWQVERTLPRCKIPVGNTSGLPSVRYNHQGPRVLQLSGFDFQERT